MTPSREKQHLQERLANLEMSSSPFQSFEIRSVFPEDYFAQLMAALPPAEYFRVGWGKYRAICDREIGAPGQRYHLWLDELLEEGSDSLELGFWRNARSWLCDPDMLRIFERKFCQPAGLRAKEGTLRGALRLVWEEGACYIRPHVDKPGKLATMVVYLGSRSDDCSELRGTALYEVDRDRFAAPLPRPMTEGFTLVREAPFVPNSTVVIPRTSYSLHGVEAHECKNGRYTLHLYLHGTRQEGAGTQAPS